MSLANMLGGDSGAPASPPIVERVSVQVLVENMIIPHAINVCVNPEVSDDERGSVLDALVMLWKRMCIIELNNKVRNICFLTK